MPKGLKTSFKKWNKLFKKKDGWDKILDKITIARPGTRAWPNQTKDSVVSFRVDYGALYTGEDGHPYRNLVLQANRRAKDANVAAVANINPHQVLAMVPVPTDHPFTEEEFANILAAHLG